MQLSNCGHLCVAIGQLPTTNKPPVLMETANTGENSYLAAAEVQRDLFQTDVAGQAEQQSPDGARRDATLLYED